MVKIMSESKEHFGKILKELRLSRQMTQEQLAELIDKSAGAVGQLERGDIYPNYETLAKIIDALNVDANLFFFKEASPFSDVFDWVADAFFGMTDSERKSIGAFLVKFAKVMLKEADVPRCEGDTLDENRNL
jgi:transcriptional regulator with XRE-family HTH domain